MTGIPEPVILEKNGITEHFPSIRSAWLKRLRSTSNSSAHIGQGNREKVKDAIAQHVKINGYYIYYEEKHKKGQKTIIKPPVLPVKNIMDVNEKCMRLHKLFSCIELHQFEKTEIDCIGFRYGIYVIFEKGEKAHGVNRIVYVGTTTGKTTTLAGRLNEHYENEGRSVFRNELALCFYEKDGDPCNLAGLFRKDKIERNEWKKTAGDEELQKYQDIHKIVSTYIRNHCYFITFAVNKEYREYWEKRIISTVHSCKDCDPSTRWLGRISPKNRIRDGKLWNIKYANSKYILTDGEFAKLEIIVKNQRTYKSRRSL
jgi:hypothetical protein